MTMTTAKATTTFPWENRISYALRYSNQAYEFRSNTLNERIRWNFLLLHTNRALIWNGMVFRLRFFSPSFAREIVSFFDCKLFINETWSFLFFVLPLTPAFLSLSLCLSHSLTLCDLNFVLRIHFVVDETALWNEILLFSRFLNVVIAARKIALKWNRVWLCLRERVAVDVCERERVTQSNHNVLHCTARP